MKQALINTHKEIRAKYGSLLAMEAFYPERKKLQRIYTILCVRYKTPIF